MHRNNPNGLLSHPQIRVSKNKILQRREDSRKASMTKASMGKDLAAKEIHYLAVQ